jgi:hypothetical protein
LEEVAGKREELRLERVAKRLEVASLLHPSEMAPDFPGAWENMRKMIWERILEKKMYYIRKLAPLYGIIEDRAMPGRAHLRLKLALMGGPGE